MSKKKLSAVLAICIAAGLSFGCSVKPVQEETHSAKPNKIKVFLLAGQSNMEGRGDGSKLTQDDKARLALAQKQIQFAHNHKPIAPLNVTNASEYVKRKFMLDKVFGPELFFGINMAEAFPDDDFIFIKRSLGGQSLYGSWNPNWSEEKAAAMNELKKPKLYADMTAYIGDTLSGYDENLYQFCAVLWVQGEADSGTKKHGTIPAEEYSENLTNLISSFRRDTGVQDLPFIMFQVGHGKVVKAMQDADQNIENVSLIPQTKGDNSAHFYPRYPMPIGHYNYGSMKRIGENFAKTYLAEYSCD